jgi:hypothetical protein
MALFQTEGLGTDYWTHQELDTSTTCASRCGTMLGHTINLIYYHLPKTAGEYMFDRKEAPRNIHIDRY